MTKITTDQPRLEAAARRAGAKFQAFHEGLTPDEQVALDRAMRQAGAEGGESPDDAAGYSTATMLGMMAARVAILLIGAPYQPPPLRDAP